MCTAYIGSSPGGDFDDHKYNGDKDDEDDMSILTSMARARSSSIDFLVFDMNLKQIAILWIREVVRNITKGTTDPSVDFCLPKLQVLKQILIKFRN